MNSGHEFRPPLVAIKAAADEAFKEQNTFVACELDEARDAVAELIEAADWALAVLESLRRPGVLAGEGSISDHYPTTPSMGLSHLREALARCKGE